MKNIQNILLTLEDFVKRLYLFSMHIYKESLHKHQ